MFSEKIEQVEDQETRRMGLIKKLTARGTSLDERLSVAQEIFPEKRKREMLASAAVDSKGRKVRYFRRLTYAELALILENGETKSHDNPEVREMFDKEQNEIKKELLNFLEDEKLLEERKGLVNELLNDFTLDNYINFIQTKIPSLEYYKLHISGMGGGSFWGATGLTSMSVGGPFGEPLDPSPGADYVNQRPDGMPVVEMVIPSDDVHVHPLFKTLNLEGEKEVDTLKIKAEWIIDIYQGEQDLIERFFKDPDSVLNSYWGKENDRRGIKREDWAVKDVHDTLMQWKESESIAELIPVEKLEETDETNQKFTVPLIA